MEGRERQVDAEQRAALQRLRAAFGYVQVLAVQVDTWGDAERAGAQGTLGELKGGDNGPGRDDHRGAPGGGGAPAAGGDDAGAGGRG